MVPVISNMPDAFDSPNHIKRQRLSAQKIRIHILCRLLFLKQTHDGDNNHQISTNNQNINDMQFHSIRFIFYSNTCVMGRPIHTCGCSRLKTDAIVDAQSNCIMLSSKAPPFLMFFPAIMNGVFHLLHGLSAMSLIDSPMISGDNNDAVFINTRFLDGIHNTAHIAVQFFQFGIISRSIVSVTVPLRGQGCRNRKHSTPVSSA